MRRPTWEQATRSAVLATWCAVLAVLALVALGWGWCTGSMVGVALVALLVALVAILRAQPRLPEQDGEG